MKRIAISGAMQTGKTELVKTIGKMSMACQVNYEKVDYSNFDEVSELIKNQIQKEKTLLSFYSDSTVLDVFAIALLENYGKDIDMRKVINIAHSVINHSRNYYDYVFMLPAGVIKSEIGLYKQSIQASLIRGLWSDITINELIKGQEVDTPTGKIKIPDTVQNKAKCKFFVIPNEYDTVNKRAEFLFKEIGY